MIKNKARIYNFNQLAGHLCQLENDEYSFQYIDDYQGPAISLTMPVDQKQFRFKTFPPFFDGLLPEGVMLEALLKQAKIDRHDYFKQLITVGSDLVGAITVELCDD